MAEEQSATPEAAEEEDFPRNWRFDEDGPEVKGTFAKFDVGQTEEHGACPIVVLNVDGEERSVWLFHTALRNKFAEEVQRRDFQVGEQINIRQAGEQKSKNNRKYTKYIVGFPDAPPIDAKAIFGVSAIAAPVAAYQETETPEAPEETKSDW